MCSCMTEDQRRGGLEPLSNFFHANVEECDKTAVAVFTDAVGYPARLGMLAVKKKLPIRLRWSSFFMASPPFRVVTPPSVRAAGASMHSGSSLLQPLLNSYPIY